MPKDNETTFELESVSDHEELEDHVPSHSRLNSKKTVFYESSRKRAVRVREKGAAGAPLNGTSFIVRTRSRSISILFTLCLLLGGFDYVFYVELEK